MFSRSADNGGQASLNDIRVASPCPASWERMVGSERVRHCSECNLNVFNLSAMSEADALQLLAEHAGKRMCVRFYRRADGTVLTQDCPWTLRHLARKTLRIASACLAGIVSVTFAFAKGKPPAKSPSCACQESRVEHSGLQLSVADQDGAVIPDAEISIQNKDGEEAKGKTNSAGEWRQQLLAAGEHQLTVRSKGFRPYTAVVHVREKTLLALKIKLAVAEAQVTVEVTSTLGVIQGTTVGIIATTQSLIPSIPSRGGALSPLRQ